MEVPGMRIRRAVDGDRDGIWPLVEQFAMSYRPRSDRFAEAFSAVLDDPSMLALVAVDEQRVVGYLLANRHQTFFANAPVAWIEEIMVDEAARRRGVGRALMSAAESWSADAGAAYVALATRRASEFYCALEYEESATFFRKRLRRFS
jgi:GNAT superfamily N-acetyltransferase